MKEARSHGFTLIEVTVVLLALGILAGVLLPSIGGFNSLARKVRLKEDLGVLCSMMKVMLDDVGNSAFFQTRNYSQRGYSASFGSASGYSTSAAASGMLVTQSTGPGSDWCVNCDLPRSDCGNCGDDCNEECTHPPVTAETTQTWNFTGGGGARSWGASSSYGRVSGAGSYWSGYGGRGWPLGLLVGSGDTPGSAIGYTEWQLDVGAGFTQTTSGIYPTAMTFAVGTLEGQLVHGDPSLYGDGYTYASGTSGIALQGGSGRDDPHLFQPAPRLVHRWRRRHRGSGRRRRHPLTAWSGADRSTPEHLNIDKYGQDRTTTIKRR